MIMSIIPLETGMYRASVQIGEWSGWAIGFSHTDAMMRLFGDMRAVGITSLTF